MDHRAVSFVGILALVVGTQAIIAPSRAAGESPPSPTPSAGTATASAEPAADEAPAGPVEFTFVSPALSEFWGRPITMRCAVIDGPGAAKTTSPPAPSTSAPPNPNPPPAQAGSSRNTASLRDPPPVCYIVHGFGGSHRMAWRHGARLAEQVRRGDAPAMLYVYLDASCPFGHHEFADSVNNGPWGTALVDEFIPAIERRFGGPRSPERRFLTGHSSGGWSVLWLQVNYPGQFGGCWATAPDSIDFRDFSGVDLATATNLYRDPEGTPRPLIEHDGAPVSDIETFVRGEVKANPIGGQFFSFDAVFSPRGDDGLPMPMFDRDSGEIDRAVVEAWQRYDIGRILRTRWTELAPTLAGKLHVWCGEWDTFRLDGAVRLLKADLAALGSDADILLVPERDHGSIVRPHAELWPKGMELRVWSEMAAKAAIAEAAQKRTGAEPATTAPIGAAAQPHSHPHDTHHDEYAIDAVDLPLDEALAAGRAPHALLHAGHGDPSRCVCDLVKPRNGWCARCAVGYVAGVPIRSEILFETLDPHGHEIGLESVDCQSCRAAAAGQRWPAGWCTACRMGWHRGLAWMTRITWTFAHGRWIEDPAGLCASCQAVASSDPPRAGEWCAACSSGVVGKLRFDDPELHREAVKQFGILSEALSIAPRCQLCACATVMDDECPTCRIAYRDGAPAKSATHGALSEDATRKPR